MNSTYTCDLAALSVEQRQRYKELAKKLRPAVVDWYFYKFFAAIETALIALVVWRYAWK